MMASIKDATLPVMVTYHNDTRRHFAREIQQSPPGRNDLPEADSRKPMRQMLAIPPTPDMSQICLFPHCPWVGFLCHISLSTFWPPRAVRASHREPQHTLSESWEDLGVRLGPNKDFSADPSLGQIVRGRRCSLGVCSKCCFRVPRSKREMNGDCLNYT